MLRGWVVKRSVGTAFVAEQEHDATLQSRLRFYSPVLFGGEVFFSVEYEGKTVGIALCMRESRPRFVGFAYVSVDAEFRNQGVAGCILDDVVAYMGEHGLSILDSSEYMADGLRWIKPRLRRMADAKAFELLEYGVSYRAKKPQV